MKDEKRFKAVCRRIIDNFNQPDEDLQDSFHHWAEKECDRIYDFINKFYEKFGGEKGTDLEDALAHLETALVSVSFSFGYVFGQMFDIPYPKIQKDLEAVKIMIKKERLSPLSTQGKEEIMKDRKELSEKETLMEKILLYHLHFAIGWAYYAGSCRCFSPISDERLKGFTKNARNKIIRELRKTGIFPLEAPLKPSDENYKILSVTGKMFPGDLPAKKDLPKYSPKCRKRQMSSIKSARMVIEDLMKWY